MNDQTQTSDIPEGASSTPMTNMDEMAFLVASWFDQCRTDLDQAYNIPDGTPLKVTFEENGPEEDILITGDLLKGFKAGCIVAMSIFGQLPFAVVKQEAPAQDDQPASGN